MVKPIVSYSIALRGFLAPHTSNSVEENNFELCRWQETHEALLEAKHASDLVPGEARRRQAREATDHSTGTPEEGKLVTYPPATVT